MHGYKVTEDGLRRERRLALLTLWREAIKNILPNAQSMELEMSAQQTIQKLDESRELPELLRYMDVAIYGRPLWFFCVDQLSTKDRPPLWCILEFLATELPTAMAINLLERTRDALVRFQVEPLDNVCLKIIASSTYPIATALYLAAFMSQNGVRDSSRSDRFAAKSEKYVAIATHLLAQIESDHLLAILIEIPSNIEDLSILDIVIRFKLEGFLEFHRLQPIFMNMWTEYKYLDPSKKFRNKESDSIFVFELCRKNPALFYYSPVGAFTLQCTMYIIHVLLVSLLTTQLLYPYKDLETLEVVVWVFNAGFVLYEFMELAIRRPSGYFQYYSNWVGFITSIIWVILAILRFATLFKWRQSYYCEDIKCDDFPSFEPDPCPGDPDWNNDTSDHPCFRNTPLTEIYMIFWAIQVVLLWCRMSALLQRNRHAGPLLRMILNMMAEIASFALLLFLFMVGFVLAVLYIVGGDVGPSEELGGGLNRITSVFLYHIQALLAAQEWSVVVSNDEGFNSDRSVLVETCMVFLSLFGTFILMNLFIALLTITYESAKQSNKLKTNFARITHTIELDRKSAIMPPPLNILVFLLTIIYQLFEVAIIFITCGYWQTKLQILYPIKYSLYKELKMKEKETKHRRRGSMAPFTGVSTIIGADGTGSPKHAHPRGSLVAGMKSQHSQAIAMVNDSDSDDDTPNHSKGLARLNTELASQTFFQDVTIDAVRDQHTMGVLDYRTHCGCFVRAVEGHKSNPCKNLNKQWKLRHRESYCRHCRHSLKIKQKDKALGDTKKNEPIDPYFNLFKHYQLLDEDDKKLIRLRLNKRNICPHCYRVYKSDIEDNDKRKKKYALSRFQVVLEVMSYYVFIFFIWWWLVIVLLVPAFITFFIRRLNHDYHEQTTDFNQSIIHNVSQTDPEYRMKVEQVIKEYNDKDDYGPGNGDNFIQREVTGNSLLTQKQSESLTEKDPSPSPLRKYESLHPKHKTRTDLNPRLKQFQDSVEEEFNDLYIGRKGGTDKLPTIYSKPGSETSTDEKLNRMEKQMQEIRNLILTQNTLKLNSNNLSQESADPSYFSPKQINKRKKKVTFSSDIGDTDNNATHRRREKTDFDTLLAFMQGMKSELSNIKQQLHNPGPNLNEHMELKEQEQDEDEDEDDETVDDINGLLLETPRDDNTLTPRLPSHARGNNRQINHLDIGNILPSPSPNKSTHSTAL